MGVVYKLCVIFKLRKRYLSYGDLAHNVSYHLREPEGNGPQIGKSGGVPVHFGQHKNLLKDLED